MRNSKKSREGTGSMHWIGEQLRGPSHIKFIFGVLPPALELCKGCICRVMSGRKDQSSAGWNSHTQGVVRLTIMSVLTHLGGLKMSLMPEGQAGSQETVLFALGFSLHIMHNYSHLWGSACTLRVCCSSCPRWGQENFRHLWGSRTGQYKELPKASVMLISLTGERNAVS